MSVAVHPEAAAELKAAAVFYSQRANVEVGLGLLDEFERTVAVIEKNPELGVYGGELRVGCPCGVSPSSSFID